MTSTETREQISKEFNGIKYILTSGMRSKLLLAIYENPKNLDELRNLLKKPSATILHGLKELENSNLVKKANKQYELTSNGYLITTNMVKLVENWYAVNKSKNFWNNHDLSHIPDDVLKNMYLLKDAEYVNSTTSDLSNAFNTYLKMISKANKLRVILPIYSEKHLKHLIKLLNENKLESLELIVNREILNSILNNDTLNESLIDNEKVTIRSIKRKINLFLTVSDDFMSLTLFFKDGHYDDSQILIAKDENALKWALNLISYY